MDSDVRLEANCAARPTDPAGKRRILGLRFGSLLARKWWFIPLVLMALYVRWPGLSRAFHHDEWQTLLQFENTTPSESILGPIKIDESQYDGLIDKPQVLSILPVRVDHSNPENIYQKLPLANTTQIYDPLEQYLVGFLRFEHRNNKVEVDVICTVFEYPSEDLYKTLIHLSLRRDKSQGIQTIGMGS